MLFLFFKIHDKVTPIYELYLTFTLLGGVGFILGLFRWWVGAFWIIFPVLVAFIIFEDLYSLLGTGILDLSRSSYLLHYYISILTGLTLNIFGVLIRLKKKKHYKIRLK